MTDGDGFLPELDPRPWSLSSPYGLCNWQLYIGSGSHALEALVTSSEAAPSRKALRHAWHSRRKGRAAPVLMVVLHPKGAALCGVSNKEPSHVCTDADAGPVERLCREALAQPDRHAALRLLSRVLPSLETGLLGLVNEGFLSLHELRHGVPARSDWEAAKRKAAKARGKRDGELLQALGFWVEKIDNLTSLLRDGKRRTALAVMLDEGESPEAGSERFNNLSPVSYALKKADDEELRWVILTQGDRLRLYASSVDAGVGRRGRTETWIECQPSLLADGEIAYLWLLCSAEALAKDGSLSQILEQSRRFAGELADRLSERIYDRVVPTLAQGIAAEWRIDAPSPKDLTHIYETALTVLFRLLFIAYAEDRDLLPYWSNESYQRRSLKQKAQELADRVVKSAPISAGRSHWQETALLWQAVAKGNLEWGVPAYNGGLFADDPDVSRIGASLAKTTLPNETFEAALRDLLVTETPGDNVGPVDFRSLGVRAFGTIYEGLLEAELAVAATDLVLEEAGSVYVPAGANETATVAAGEVYLHNRSGVRKSSGSYYTKSFAVQHLLDGALEPALNEHFSRLNRMDDTDAAEAFFDFRVADIAMGSGHFLIGAIDRIERRMAGYLADRALPGVRLELDALREAAAKNLGESADPAGIEDGQLLRRLIARRCVYGVDLNGLAVQLARLAVWIHTFVPGLPLSFLDHNLVRGNALVGVGGVDDIRKKFDAAAGTLFAADAEALLGRASQPLKRLANINDATLADIDAARAAAEEAREAISGTERLCDIIAAQAISDDPRIVGFPFEDWERRKEDAKTLAIASTARGALAGLHPLHFPIAFPEVFLRRRPGFDVILGNPPWQEATVEEDAFWERHCPGFRRLPQGERETEKARLHAERPDMLSIYAAEVEEMVRLRRALVGGPYPGMGTGDPDLYKAFCWRFWHLSAEEGGRIGVVLPRSALAAKGSAEFRRTMFGHSSQVDVTMLSNNRRWVFPAVTPKYTFGLVCIARGAPKARSIHLRGPFTSKIAFCEGVGKPPATLFSHEDVLAWNDTASLPLLAHSDSMAVFAQLRKAPRLDLNRGGGGGLARPARPRDGRHLAEGVHGLRPASPWWRARPDTELHATAQKKIMSFGGADRVDGFWPVYKGTSFNLWEPDTGIYYAMADPGPVLDWLQRKRAKAGKGGRNSPHREFSPEFLQDRSTLPCFAPRVAFRDVARSTDQRTVIACLVPPKVFIGNQAPYLLWPRGDKKDQAFLLGVLCSIPLDWYARCCVETHVNYFVFNPFPIPRPRRDDARWQRVVALAGRLACPDERFAAWAEATAVDCGPLAADEKQDMIHELDAVAAHLYALKEAQLVHIFNTFHKGWDCQGRLEGVQRHFQAWKNR